MPNIFVPCKGEGYTKNKIILTNICEYVTISDYSRGRYFSNKNGLYRFYYYELRYNINISSYSYKLITHNKLETLHIPDLL